MQKKTKTPEKSAAEVEAKKAHKRALARVRKQRERARITPEQLAARRVAEEARASTWDKLSPHIVVDRESGCWIWQSRYALVFTNVRPLARAGQYGRVHADVAVWSCHNGGRPLPKGTFLRRTCGNIMCVAPSHGLVTNQVVERQKKRRLGGSHGRVQEAREVGRVGQLPRAV